MQVRYGIDHHRDSWIFESATSGLRLVLNKVVEECHFFRVTPPCSLFPRCGFLQLWCHVLNDPVGVLDDCRESCYSEESTVSSVVHLCMGTMRVVWREFWTPPLAQWIIVTEGWLSNSTSNLRQLLFLITCHAILNPLKYISYFRTYCYRTTTILHLNRGLFTSEQALMDQYHYVWTTKQWFF